MTSVAAYAAVLVIVFVRDKTQVFLHHTGCASQNVSTLSYAALSRELSVKASRESQAGRPVGRSRTTLFVRSVGLASVRRFLLSATWKSARLSIARTTLRRRARLRVPPPPPPTEIRHRGALFYLCNCAARTYGGYETRVSFFSTMISLFNYSAVRARARVFPLFLFSFFPPSRARVGGHVRMCNGKTSACNCARLIMKRCYERRRAIRTRL